MITGTKMKDNKSKLRGKKGEGGKVKKTLMWPVACRTHRQERKEKAQGYEYVFGRSPPPRSPTMRKANPLPVRCWKKLWLTSATGGLWAWALVPENAIYEL